MRVNFAFKEDPTKSILVMFPTDLKVGVGPIREMVEYMSQQNIQRGIIVVQDSLTSFARSTLSEAMPRYILEEFKEAELLVNITRHTVRETICSGTFLLSGFLEGFSRPPLLSLEL